MSGFKGLLGAAALVLAVVPMVTPAEAQTPKTIVFSGEGNRLNAYDADSGAKQTVIPSAADDPVNGRDINAQICFDPSAPRRFIAGEDTNQPDPPQGWGYFELSGSQVGHLGWQQVGKLTPTYVTGTSNAENYGCGFLSDGRLVTSDVGDQQPGEPATGQLIVWFPPFDSFDVAYCKIDVTIPTAGGIHVDAQDRVYVASNRGVLTSVPPTGLPGLTDPLVGGAVYRYAGAWPTSNMAAGGCGRTDQTGAPLVDAGRVAKQTFITGDPLGALTPSAIVPSGRGTFYVSSVFTGVIAEYNANGRFVRRIAAPKLTELLPPYPSVGTPFGLGVDASGTLWYADLGVVLGPPPGPGDQTGSLRRIRFVGGVPQPPEVVEAALAFPDGIGILQIP